jgi:hypothetical protein
MPADYRAALASDETTMDLRSFYRSELFTFDLSLPSLLHSAHAQPVEDEQKGIRYDRAAMTVPRYSDAEAAMQYLMWALEYIEKAGNQKAAQHIRIALEALREATHND